MIEDRKQSNLKILDLSNTNVRDLTNIRICENLVDLNLYNTLVDNITDLKELKKLQKLNLGKTLVSDLSVLSACSELVDLDLSDAKILDLSPLVNCTNLTSVCLSGTKLVLTNNTNFTDVVVNSLKNNPETPLANKLRVWSEVLIPALRDGKQLEHHFYNSYGVNGRQGLMAISAIQLGLKSEMIAKSDVYTLTSPYKDQNYYEKVSETEKRFKKNGYHSIALGDHRTREKGLYIYALVKQNYFKDDPIIITCAGTMGDYRLVHDLDPLGPGYEIYNKFNGVILSQINNLCDILNCEHVLVTGHSLGGAHAQYIAEELINLKVKSLLKHYGDKEIRSSNTSYKNIVKLKTISAVTFQSAGINKRNIRRSNILLSKLNQIKDKIPEEELFNINFIPHINTGDIVPFLEGGYLFSELGMPNDIVKVSYIEKVDKSSVTKADLILILSSILSIDLDSSFATLLMSYAFIRKFTSNLINAHKEFFYQNSSRQEEAHIDHRIQIYTADDPRFIKLIKKFSSREKKIVELLPCVSELREKLYNCTKKLSNSDIRMILLFMQIVQDLAVLPIKVLEVGIEPNKTVSKILSFLPTDTDIKRNSSKKFTKP